MTRVGRHELNLGCLKAKSGYNCLGGGGAGSYRTRHRRVVVNKGGVWGGLEFGMGKPQGRSSVNGRDGWYGGPSCVMRGEQGWIKGLSGKMRSGGTWTTCIH